MDNLILAKNVQKFDSRWTVFRLGDRDTGRIGARRCVASRKGYGAPIHFLSAILYPVLLFRFY